VSHHFHGVRQPVAPIPSSYHSNVVYRCTLQYPCTAHSPQLSYPKCPPFYFPFQLLPAGPCFLRSAMTRRVYPFFTDAHLISSMSIHLPNTLLNPVTARRNGKNVRTHVKPQQQLLVQRSFYLHHNFLLLTSFRLPSPQDMELHASNTSCSPLIPSESCCLPHVIFFSTFFFLSEPCPH